MSKKRAKNKEIHIINLKLICGTILFILFILSIILIFYFIDNGGYEILTEMRDS